MITTISTIDNVIVSRDILLERIKENRYEHLRTHDKIAAAYREKACTTLAKSIADIDKQINRLQKGETFKVENNIPYMPVPVSHERDYDRCIGMLELSLNDQIHLSSKDYQQYIMDEWDWKKDFVMCSGTYLGGTLGDL